MSVIARANTQPLLFFLLRLTRGQYELAEDLLQETMLRAWRRLDELPDDPVAVRRWLFTVARNLVVDTARARLARPAEVYGLDLDWVPSPEDPYERLVDRYALDGALRNLSTEHRTVLVDLYYGEATVAEVAARMGTPEGTVRSRCFYGLRAARGILDGESPDA
ncbi:sigma-70 family RNA polymerase sigma factor [Micromonospora sp. HNM0581]|uniref:sigma-70 family RNA polymerase sigma factor n=1 Tax=Micromonospora sp. HNM0581 TaxID=2716341 RepID=UPI00146EC99F|nr:sigma-70 family RNA polymerase sigma factor [Micromonospora sp. HNM0581]NLU79480.1 sigma-70 family RNA polymerase sigma factor [Micromonospora sp. HNM0581]